jgi:hypothetical protein
MQSASASQCCEFVAAVREGDGVEGRDGRDGHMSGDMVTLFLDDRGAQGRIGDVLGRKRKTRGVERYLSRGQTGMILGRQRRVEVDQGRFRTGAV